VNERPLPNDLEAEQSILGACMLRADAIDEAAGILVGDEWYQQAHRTIWSALVSLHAAGTKIDGVTLATELRRTGALERVGGMVYLAKIASETATAVNAAAHARIVREHWVRRQLVDRARVIAAKAYDGQDEAGSLLEQLEAQLGELASGQREDAMSPYVELLAATVERAEKVSANKGRMSGIRSGFADLDRMTGGWQKGDLILLAGRPKMGKSSLALAWADRAARDGHKVAIFSLEMSQVAIGTRHLSMLSRVPSLDLRTGHLEASDWECITKAASELAELPIWVSDHSGQSVSQIRNACKKLQRKSGLDLVIVDYLGLVQAGRANSREQEVAQMSSGFKALARDLDVPLILLSQLSRKVEERNDRRPVPSDLRDSGALEADCDVLVFVYRPEECGLAEFQFTGAGCGRPGRDHPVPAT
jgi:replicative DNA helicase